MEASHAPSRRIAGEGERGGFGRRCVRTGAVMRLRDMPPVRSTVKRGFDLGQGHRGRVRRKQTSEESPMTDPLLVDLSRLQFALTAMYHFLFVPLTLGLSILSP